MVRVALVTYITLLLTSATAYAQDWPPLDRAPAASKTGSDDVAVLVAVQDYAFLPDIPGARHNLADWQTFLTDALGVESVYVLADQQAVREPILNAARRAASEAQAGGTVWFIFIGHGAPSRDGTDGLLVGADGQQNPESLSARGVPQKDLVAALESGQQARTVVVLDACFSGRDGRGGALAQGAMPVVAMQQPTFGAETVVMTAARGDEFAGALPGANRPAFSYLILGALHGWANGGDEVVTAQEAVQFAQRELLRAPERKQTPQLAGRANTVLARGVNAQRGGLAVAPVAPAPAPTPAALAPNSTAAAAPVSTVDANSGHKRGMKWKNDGVPDMPVFMSMDAGIPFGNASVLNPNFAGTFGFKLNYFYGGRLEIRPLAVGHIFFEKNPNAPVDGDTLQTTGGFGDATSVTYSELEPARDRMTPILAAAGGLGFAYRNEFGEGHDMVFSGSVGYGRTIPLGERCLGFAYNESEGRAECASHTATTDAAEAALLNKDSGSYLFGRVAFHVYDIEFALQVAMAGAGRIDVGLAGALFIGYAFDP